MKHSFLFRRCVLTVGLICSCVTAFGATFTVDATTDGWDFSAVDGICDDGAGACTLRAAIDQANATVGPDTIEFNIGSGGPVTISHTQGLPDITDMLIIDGTTQPDGL